MSLKHTPQREEKLGEPRKKTKHSHQGITLGLLSDKRRHNIHNKIREDKSGASCSKNKPMSKSVIESSGYPQ